MACPRIFFIIVLDISGFVRPYGFRNKRSGVGISVAKASEARVSIIRFTHNICTAWKQQNVPYLSMLLLESTMSKLLVLFIYFQSHEMECNIFIFFTLSGLMLTAQAPVKATITATTLTVSWNCKNFAILSYTLRPHSTALTMLEKLSSVRIISEASFATSVPAIP